MEARIHEDEARKQSSKLQQQKIETLSMFVDYQKRFWPSSFETSGTFMSITEPGGGDNTFAPQRFLVEAIGTDVEQVSPTYDSKVDAHDRDGGTIPDSSDSDGGNHIASRSLLCMATDLSCQAEAIENVTAGSQTMRSKNFFQGTQSSADIAD